MRSIIPVKSFSSSKSVRSMRSSVSRRSKFSFKKKKKDNRDDDSLESEFQRGLEDEVKSLGPLPSRTRAPAKFNVSDTASRTPAPAQVVSSEARSPSPTSPSDFQRDWEDELNPPPSRTPAPDKAKSSEARYTSPASVEFQEESTVISDMADSMARDFDRMLGRSVPDHLRGDFDGALSRLAIVNAEME